MTASAQPELSSAAATRPDRPTAVVIVVALAIVVGCWEIGSGIYALTQDKDSRVWGGAISVVLGLLLLVSAGGAWQVRRWAWAAFMTIAVVGLTHQLLRHFVFEDPNYISMAFNTIVVLVLTPLDVQYAFGVRPPRNVDLARPTRNPLDVD